MKPLPNSKRDITPDEAFHMNPLKPTNWDLLNRREFLSRSAFGIGSLALSGLMQNQAASVPGRMALPHFAPKAKNIIFLFMAGAPSQLDLFEKKPELTRLSGQTIDPERLKDIRFPFVKQDPELLASPYKFQRHGQSGAILSEF
jgi:hypothetical protein